MLEKSRSVMSLACSKTRNLNRHMLNKLKKSWVVEYMAWLGVKRREEKRRLAGYGLDKAGEHLLNKD